MKNGGHMTLDELLNSGMVKDSDTITLHLPIIGTLGAIRKGHWFNDQILKETNCKISNIRYSAIDEFWDIVLEADEPEGDTT